MDLDSPPRMNPAGGGRDKNTVITTTTTHHRAADSTSTSLYAPDTPDAMHKATARPAPSTAASDAPAHRVNRPAPSAFSRRDAAEHHAPTHSIVSSSFSLRPDNNVRPDRAFQRQQRPPFVATPSSGANSQDTTTTIASSTSAASTHDVDMVFTPPASGSDGGMSQESQLLQLSQLAAQQEKMPDHDPSGASGAGNGASSRKRMADGAVKNGRERSSASPVRGHSRNTSTVSMASTSGSRIGEISTELKTRLSYAMVKLNNGWQSHSIDQVENLASQAASPTSSNSTVHLRNGASASPQFSSASTHRGSNNTTPAAGPQNETNWREQSHSRSQGSPTSPVKPALAPPVSIQPSRPMANPRRNSNAKYTPAYLSHAQPSPSATPHTPGHPSPYLGTPHQRTPMADPILFSPHQNVREQDAIESLLFMSSPGNSANLKHNFPASSSSQPLPSARPGAPPHRTALPTGQPRKSLPSGRPVQHGHSLSQPPKRVGFEKSPPTTMTSEIDIDDPHVQRLGAAASKRKVLNGRPVHGGDHHIPAAAPKLKHIPMSSGLTLSSRPRPALADEDIDRMLDRVAAADDSSDSEGEILIPVPRPRRDVARV